MPFIGATLSSAPRAQGNTTTTPRRMPLSNVLVFNEDSAFHEEQQPFGSDDFTIFCDEEDISTSAEQRSTSSGDFAIFCDGEDNAISEEQQPFSNHDFTIFCDESEEKFRPANGDINIGFEDGSRYTIPELQGTVGVLQERHPNIVGRAIDHNGHYGHLPATMTKEHAPANSEVSASLHYLHPNPEQGAPGRHLTPEQVERSARMLSLDNAIDQLHDPLIYEDRQVLRRIVRLLDIRRQELLRYGISVEEDSPEVELPETVDDIEDLAMQASVSFDYSFVLSAIEAIDTLAQSVWFCNEEEQESNKENIPPELMG
ncbi:hypothetical protein HER10_EVM0011525 [Colletotrichum scovillei]|uniref:Uncharacterized protein n=1 Tax=Colletotrichum scovillei TaxID=1209932 RepID=A0A9P7QXG1_9PEZI|nr:uncharacterized protein HER10_EVM0011525 [Colletotrichum scovillei]KAF4781416.1 hypothetical protein HER10_EVM0011525 [Colletotrichum scovillei]KAG7045170.1 hypothetical protein JMJ77_0009257 [Colletotrichum scovillei]KAG7052333.1 hypothetical protein JMJ78_0005353 [Colletotrichum scovillei]KAG7064624.1 hypothetical protein JMJ76_0012386 [Colletotrichum scovillei]